MNLFCSQQRKISFLRLYGIIKNHQRYEYGLGFWSEQVNVWGPFSSMLPYEPTFPRASLTCCWLRSQRALMVLNHPGVGPFPNASFSFLILLNPEGQHAAVPVYWFPVYLWSWGTLCHQMACGLAWRLAPEWSIYVLSLGLEPEIFLLQHPKMLEL